MARARTAKGRFKKSRKRTVRKKSYRVRGRRSNPKTGSYYPKKGQRRLSPMRRRRAYTRRSNKKGILQSPAVRYSIAAAVGFFGAAWADTQPMLNPTKDDGSPLLPFGLRGSLLGAVALSLLSRYALKGKNRQYGYAAAVGMAAPSVIGMVNKALPGGASHSHAMMHSSNRPLSLPRHSHNSNSAGRFVRASANIDNQVA